MLKYSHAKNCTAKISAPSALPAVKEAEEEEEDEEEEPATEEEEEEEEEVKPSPPPILKRTVSVAYPPQPTVMLKAQVSKQLPPVKKNFNKVKQPQPACKDQPQQPTPTNIYGRENRNERAKRKTEKVCNLFVNAF